LERTARLALGLAVLQVALGVLNVLLALPVEVTAAHSATAAALVLATGVLGRSCFLRSTIP
jgi:heme A synthase